MRRAQVELHPATLARAAGEKMDVDLVGPELRAAMADLGKIEGWGVMLRPADPEDDAAPVAIATHQHVDGFGKLRTTDQAENGMHVALARGTCPELELLGSRFIQKIMPR